METELQNIMDHENCVCAPITFRGSPYIKCYNHNLLFGLVSPIVGIRHVTGLPELKGDQKANQADSG